MTPPTELNRHAFPPGGWVFVQPQTGWRAPTPTSSTFEQTVQLILKHRLGNPAAVQKHKLSTDKTAVEAELENFTRARLHMQAAPPPPPKTQPPSRAAGVVGVVAEAGKRIGVGIGIIRDWFGDDCAAVDPDIAEERAEVCAECPQNRSGNILQRLEGMTAEGIRMTIEAKNTLSLRTPLDEKLHSCMACDCHLGLKVWVPMKHIMAKTRPETFDYLQGVKTNSGKNCWMISEQQSLNTLE